MACPVCFGDSNEPMAIATNYGIWFMLGIVAVMLSAFASFFVYLMRRGRLAGSELEPGAAQQQGRADAARFARGQEETA